MERSFNQRAPNPRRRGNRKAPNCTTNSGQLEPSVQQDKLSELMKENSCLKEELKEAELMMESFYSQKVSAEKKASKLQSELQRTRSDLHALLQQMQQDTNAATAKKSDQREDTSVSELVLQLQTAQEDLKRCTSKLQSTDTEEQEADHEQNHKSQALKAGILKFGEKLQEQQAALMKMAIKIVPCTSEDQTKSAKAEGIEMVNIHLQKLQIDLLNQALRLKTVCKTQKGPASKYQWIRTHQDQKQQTDEPDQLKESQSKKDQEQQTDEPDQVKESQSKQDQEQQTDEPDQVKESQSKQDQEQQTDEPDQAEETQSKQDQEQQTDEPDQAEESQSKRNQEQQTDEPEQAEESQSKQDQEQQTDESAKTEESKSKQDQEHKTKELSSKEAVLAFSEMQLQLKKEQQMKEAAQQEVEKIQASFTIQLEQLKKVHAESKDAQKMAEEKLEAGLRMWQEEISSLQTSLQLLQQTLMQQELEEKEGNVASRMDNMEKKISEMPEKGKNKKIRSLLARIFGRSGSGST